MGCRRHVANLDLGRLQRPDSPRRLDGFRRLRACQGRLRIALQCSPAFSGPNQQPVKSGPRLFSAALLGFLALSSPGLRICDSTLSSDCHSAREHCCNLCCCSHQAMLHDGVPYASVLSRPKLSFSVNRITSGRYIFPTPSLRTSPYVIRCEREDEELT